VTKETKATKGHHKLLVWQKARQFVKLIYTVTQTLPEEEKFGLKSQMRRAAVSVVLNIVEGHRRSSTREFLRFLDNADGSLAEVEAYTELCLDLGYLKDEVYEKVENQRREVGYLLTAFKKGLKQTLK
jgi:four helix bundle protein